MCEPRGHKDMVGALLVEPISKEADIGVIYMDANRWINMCGHATIGVSMTLVNENLVKVVEPLLLLPDEDGKTKSVSFENIPSFLFEENCLVNNIHFDISYSGSFFALVDADQLDIEININNANKFKELGVNLLRQINEKYDVKHPTLPINRVVNVEFYHKTDDGQKNIVISEEGMIDRSPCGTGTCAKLAYMYNTNKLKLNETFINQSFTGVSFKGRVIEETKIDKYKAIISSITGVAYIDGYSAFLIDEDDPLKYRFVIN